MVWENEVARIPMFTLNDADERARATVALKDGEPSIQLCTAEGHAAFSASIGAEESFLSLSNKPNNVEALIAVLQGDAQLPIFDENRVSRAAFGLLVNTANVDLHAQKQRTHQFDRQHFANDDDERFPSISGVRDCGC